MRALTFHPALKWLLGLCLGVAAISWPLRPSEQAAKVSRAVSAVPPSEVRGNVTVWSWNIAAKSLPQLVALA